MRCAVVNNLGNVVNVVEVNNINDITPPANHTLFLDDAIDIGDRVVNGSRVPKSVSPPPPEPVRLITRRQFCHQMVVQGVLTPAQAMSFAQGVIPSNIETAILNGVSAGQRDAARLYLAGEVLYRREHPLIATVIRNQLGWSEEDMDAFFAAAHTR